MCQHQPQAQMPQQFQLPAPAAQMQLLMHPNAMQLGRGFMPPPHLQLFQAHQQHSPAAAQPTPASAQQAALHLANAIGSMFGR